MWLNSSYKSKLLRGRMVFILFSPCPACQAFTCRIELRRIHDHHSHPLNRPTSTAHGCARHLAVGNLPYPNRSPSGIRGTRDWPATRWQIPTTTGRGIRRFAATRWPTMISGIPTTPRSWGSAGWVLAAWVRTGRSAESPNTTFAWETSTQPARPRCRSARRRSPVHQAGA